MVSISSRCSAHQPSRAAALPHGRRGTRHSESIVMQSPCRVAEAPLPGHREHLVLSTGTARRWERLGEETEGRECPRCPPSPQRGQGLLRIHLQLCSLSGEAMAEKNTCEKLMEDNAESGALLQELMECKKRSAELAAVLREQTKVREALKEDVEMEMKKLQKAQRRVEKRTAPRRKMTRREEHMSSLMQEAVAVRLDEQTAAQKHPLVTTWLRAFLLFLGLLQLVFFTLFVLQKDILHWVLPGELATALGIRPPKPALF
ncbi:uncharacterized protein LOC107056515 isoform X1 [Gallus gallus]|uniref:uncharacterized protein LOC107056515 isoform X1 n=2 Tax=Gallus gallus TaxID=9031 RepID=UPI001AE82BDE|nr:uncharacterized protein LOC107056515 isoform X1 [Gallus gallus]